MGNSDLKPGGQHLIFPVEIINENEYALFLTTISANIMRLNEPSDFFLIVNTYETTCALLPGIERSQSKRRFLGWICDS